MKAYPLILCAAATGRLLAQDVSVKQPMPDPAVFHVLAEAVVRKADGGTVTFRKVTPPTGLPAAQIPAQAAPQPTPEQMERLRRLAMKAQHHLTISATIHEGGLTLLRWSCGGKNPLQAWSNVDFRLVPDWASVETETAVYSFLKTMRPTAAMTPRQAAQIRLLPADGNPAFVLLDGRKAVTPEEMQAAAGMAALHAYFESNREVLIKRHAQQQSDRAARELEERHASPPLPKHEVIHFWPLPKPTPADVRDIKSEGGTK